jgi:predicted metal-dependent hydrolase
MGRMHPQLLFKPVTETYSKEFIRVGIKRIPMLLVRNLRSRRYIIRLRPDGSVRVTIPRGGSTTEARMFVERNRQWLERQLHALSMQMQKPSKWSIGTEILFRGELVKIEADTNGQGALLRLGSDTVKLHSLDSNLRLAVEKHLRRLAEAELPQRVFEYSALHKLTVRGVVVRNQRSRWGSCSRRGTISLNWRLIQAPSFVRDYIIIHELMHLREMNHSHCFWNEVERAWPKYQIAEQWLKKHSILLR